MPHHPTAVTRRQGLKTAAIAAVTVPFFGAQESTATTEAPAPATIAERGSRGRGGRLDVMTFNVRFASDTGTHSWPVRRPVMRELLRAAQPHVIGAQEVLYQQLRDIEADLGPHYDWIGTGRGGGSKDEFMAVIYDTRRMAPIEFDHFWLSDTPYTIASNTWGADWLRMVTWVHFRDLQVEGQEFYVLNTHLDNVSQYARKRSVRLIGERMAEFDRSLPVVVTGDFNVPAHRNSVYDEMLDLGLVDVWDAAEERGELFGTFHGYKPLVPDGKRIDWILATPGVKAHRAWIDTFSRDGQFPSDHLPVQATLTLG
ncbi:endonuclease/exonuclease/phosphatase family protein [Streptomyces cavernae]|uniref:endonuclease/exonuclease/phosphatase family protein n=1 Tax=Streptomyces cavernae TaxID=2259034 RepID=UPI00192E67B5|nr:endonuclease/exonuclease/phosphatase family protein [Streptomyces cavernae]